MKTITQKLAICIVMLLGFITQSIAQNWEVVGQAGFSAGPIFGSSIAFSNENRPYVSMRDGGNGNRATVMKFDGTNWVNVGTPGFSAGNVTYVKLVFSNDGEPYVTTEDWINNNVSAVMKFDGTNWVYVGEPGFSVTGSQSSLSLAFSNNGEPYIAFSEDYITSDYKATVMKFDGTNWVYVGTPGFSAGSLAYEISLAFNSIGEPYLAYSNYLEDIEEYTINVMKFDGSNWINVGNAGFYSGYVADCSLAFYDDVPYVAFDNYASTENNVIVMKYDGTNWIPVGTTGIIGQGIVPKLVFNNSGEPYVVFMDGDDYNLSVKKFDGSNWIYVGMEGFANGLYGPTIALNNNGEPYVAFGDLDNNYKTTVMKYANTMSVDDVAFESVKVYPNPVKDLLNFTEPINNIKLYDILGKTVKTQEASTNSLDISTLNNGMYFIKGTRQNGLPFESKIIKE